MNEAVDKVIEEREALDRGFPAGMVLSTVAHVVVLALAAGSAWLTAKPRFEAVPMGFAVPIPRGGGGPLVEAPAPAAPAPTVAEPAPPAPPKVEPPPKVIKPPKEEPKKGLPRPDAKKSRTKPTPPPRTAPATPPDARGTSPAGGARGATGQQSSATPGLGIIGPAGPGSPTGTDPFGDWYIAGVQRKIWTIWTRQVRSGFTRPITVSFTILADGAVEPGSVRIVQSSGAQLLDNAALRAVMSASPFGPLPKNYGTNPAPIQALFQPIP